MAAAASTNSSRLVWALVAAAAVLLCGSLTRLLQRAQSCGCEQTYMYSSYSEVAVLDPSWSRHRYRLMFYREAAHPKQGLPPTGHPALLIPGNAGSFEQVRALASETARLTHSARQAAGSGSSSVAAAPEIDWYALDLRGELSAFDGHLLQEQTRFALACLRQLAAMYHRHHDNTSSSSSGGVNVSLLPPMQQPQPSRASGVSGGLLLVGHSMGGVVARAAAAAAWSDPLLGPGSISLLLTLAAPHVSTPLMLQPALSRFYAGPPLSRPLPEGLPVVSLHGGAADMQVSPLLTWVPRAQQHPTGPTQQQQSQAQHLWRAPFNNASDSLSPAAAAAGAAPHPAVTSAAAVGGAAAAAPLRLTQPTLTVPGVWQHAGHTQIDWCNQLVRRLAAALLEVVAHQQQQQLAAAGGVPARLLQQPEEQQQQEGQEWAPQHHQQQQQARKVALGTAVGQQPGLPAAHTSEHTALAGRAAVTSQVLLWQFLTTNNVLSSLTAAQQQQQPPAALPLLLPSIAPEDVRLTQQSSCQQHQGPEWFVHSQGAAAVHLPDPQQTQQTFFKAAPAGGGGGAVFIWDVAAAAAAVGTANGGDAAAADLVLLASGIKPCSGFRVWVGRQQPQQPGATAAATTNTSSSNSSSANNAEGLLHMLLQQQQGSSDAATAVTTAAAAGSWVDVTPRVSPLPVLQDDLVLPVRNFDAWEEVMAGRDYLAPAAWALTLQPGHNTPSDAVSHVAVWLAPAANDSSSSHQPAASASVTMQWVPAPQQQQQLPEVSLGLLQLLQPLQRPAGGPMLLQVNLRQRSTMLLQQLLALQVMRSDGSNGSNDSSQAAGSCWQPVAVYTSIWGGQQHSLVVNTTLASMHRAAGLLGLLQRTIAPWLAAGTKASKVSGAAAATYSQLQLFEVLTSSSSSNSTPHLLLLLDPGCSYELQLGWDLVGAGSLLLLGHASAAAGIAVALLLLVLSHQMSSLVRVMSIARHGTAHPVPRSSYAASPPAAGVERRAGGYGSSSSRGSSPVQHSGQQQQQLSGASSSSRSRRTPSPTGAVAAAGSKAGYLLGLPSPAAGVARRLVRTASSDLPAADTHVAATFYDDSSSTDSDSDLAPLLSGSLPRYHQQQQSLQQPSVADSGAPALLQTTLDAATTLDGVNEAADDAEDAEWGLSGLRQTRSVSAMQRLRRQMATTLGGAPPPIEQQLAVAAAAAAGGRAGSRPGSKQQVAGEQQQQQQQRRSLWPGHARAGTRPLAGGSSGGGSRQQPGKASATRQQQQQQQQRRAASWAGVGISVLGSLIAVTGDMRVLLLVVLLSAAAGSLNSLNPDSIWHHSSSSDAAYGLLQRVLGLLGLLQRGDSPGVVGSAVLLGVALLVLLAAVAVSIALKWCLDYVSAAVAAFNRSLTPDPYTLEAIRRASQGGAHPAVPGVAGYSQQQHTLLQLPLSCCCALCTAAQVACGDVAAAGLCGLSSSSSSSQPRAAATLGDPLSGRTTPTDVVPQAPQAPVMSAATAAAPVPGDSSSTKAAAIAGLRSGSSSFTDLRQLLSSMRHSPSAPARGQAHGQHSTTIAAATAAGAGAAVGGAAAATAGAAGSSSSSALWWQQRRSQVLVAVLLLLAVANLALGLGGAVLLLFITWHLPSSSTQAGQRAAQLLLGARSSRAASRASSPAPHTTLSIHPAAAAAPGGSLNAAQPELLPSLLQRQAAAQQQSAHTAGGASAFPGAAAWPAQQQHRSGVRSEAGLLLDGAASVGSEHDVTAEIAAWEERPPHLYHQQQQQQPFEAAAVECEPEAEAAAEVDEAEGLDLQLHGLQPLEKLGTINSLLQQERARREAAEVAAASTLPAAPQHKQQQQQQLGVLGASTAPRNNHSDTSSSSSSSSKAALPALILPQTGLPPLPPTPPQPPQQQQQRLVQVASRVDSTGARALALHQLTCHMCHAWLLLYSCCFWMLLPSLLAWLKLPVGQQHLSLPLDVLTLLPVVLHCVAISAGRVDALVGFGPATAAAAWRSQSWAAAGGAGGGPSSSSSSSSSSSVGSGMAAVALGVRPLDLHKLAVRAAAAYMFAAALLGQAVRWTVVVALVAVLMLAGRQAVEGWYHLHALWLYAAGRPAATAARFRKQKGT